MKSFTPEMIEKAKAAKTAEALMALAKENDVEMTEEEAKIYLAQLNPASGELADDELDNVAGGGCGDDQYEIREGDRVCVRQDVGNHCSGGCGGRTGIYTSNGTTWSVKCDKEGCSGYIFQHFVHSRMEPIYCVYKI